MVALAHEAQPMEKPWYSKAKPYRNLKHKIVSLVGAPLAAGQHMAGVDKAPQAFRDGGLQNIIEELGWGFKDLGDLDVLGAMSAYKLPSNMRQVKNCEKIGRANRLIHETVKREASQGNFVLTVGGDHSVGSATVSAMKAVHEHLCVIWVDAHGDCNTAATSPSGNYHGMAAAHALNWIRPPLPEWEWMRPEYMISEHKFAFIALRDIDRHERRMLRESGVAVFTMHDIDRYGIGQIMDMALHRVNPHADRPIHLSFDIDACDPSVAPGTGTCSRGGLNFREAHFICQKLSMTSDLVSMDLVEVNPDLDLEVPGRMHGDHASILADKVTVRMGLELIASALGRTIL